MKVLIVASYNKNRYAPFIVEQAESLQKAGCETEWFGVQGKGITGYLKVIPKLRAKIQDYKPDVVHAHYGLSCMAANLATRRVPVVSTYHGSDINIAKIRPLSKITMRLSAWNIFVSKQNMALVGAIEGQKCSLIPCGINLPQPWSELQKQMVGQLTFNQWVESLLDKGKKNVLFAGAFDNAVKDPELAKQVVAIANKFEICNLKSELNSNEIDLIELKGYTRDQVNALMYSCDAFLLTSKTEGSPQVIKEAMACGCPIVSVSVGDVAERTKGLDGCFVVPSREPKDICAALMKAIALKGRTKGRERIIADGLSNDFVAQRIIEVYKTII